MHNDSIEKLDACAFIVGEAHPPNNFREVKIGQNNIFPHAKLTEG